METKPLASGVLVFTVLLAVHLTLVQFAPHMPPLLIWMPYFLAFLGGLVTGYLAKTKVWWQLLILGLVMSVILGTFNYVWSWFGVPGDLPGLVGSITVAIMAAPFVLALSFVGGTIGEKVNRGAGT